jgi:hypothetical protein
LPLKVVPYRLPQGNRCLLTPCRRVTTAEHPLPQGPAPCSHVHCRPQVPGRVRRGRRVPLRLRSPVDPDPPLVELPPLGPPAGRGTRRLGGMGPAGRGGAAQVPLGVWASSLLDLCMSSLRRGHANLLCIVPILTDDPRRESFRGVGFLLFSPEGAAAPADAVRGPSASRFLLSRAGARDSRPRLPHVPPRTFCLPPSNELRSIPMLMGPRKMRGTKKHGRLIPMWRP